MLASFGLFMLEPNNFFSGLLDHIPQVKALRDQYLAELEAKKCKKCAKLRLDRKYEDLFKELCKSLSSNTSSEAS